MIDQLDLFLTQIRLKPEIQKIYHDIGVSENIKMKSSLKFCVVAAGEYDGYVAEPRAYEWDIAAGHAILEHRQVVQYTDFWWKWNLIW